MLYWKVGNRIRQDILREKRARYGEEIVPTLSAQLVPDFGTGFGVRNLFRMIKFAEVFPEEKIVSTRTSPKTGTRNLKIRYRCKALDILRKLSYFNQNRAQF